MHFLSPNKQCQRTDGRYYIVQLKTSVSCRFLSQFTILYSSDCPITAERKKNWFRQNHGNRGQRVWSRYTWMSRNGREWKLRGTNTTVRETRVHASFIYDVSFGFATECSSGILYIVGGKAVRARFGFVAVNRVQWTDQAFFVAAPRVWNSLPSSVAASDTLQATAEDIFFRCFTYLTELHWICAAPVFIL